MAITTVIQPALNTVATRPVVWQFESNTANIVRLILVVTDIFNTVSTIEQNPEPGTTGVFKFNISSILSDQLSFTTSNSLATSGINSTISQETAFFNYTVIVYEVLDDGSTGYPSLSDYNSAVFTSHNYVLTHKEWVKPFMLSDYDMSSGTGKKFLTNATGEKCITKGYSEYLAMHKVQDNATFVRDYYDSSDVFLFSQRYPVVNTNPAAFPDQYGKISGAGLPGSGSAGSVDEDYFYSLPLDASNWQLVDAGNGFAYAAPGRSGSILKLDLSNNTVQTFGSFLAGVAPQYTIGILNPVDGKIYFTSDSSGALDVLVLDPSNDTYTTFGTFTAGFVPNDLTITPAGIIYATSTTATTFFKIDTVLQTVTTIVIAGANGGGTAEYSSNGFVYFFGGTGEFYKLDTSNDATSTVVDPLLLNTFSDSVIINGIVYGITNIGGSASVVKVDTLSADTITTKLITSTNPTGLLNISSLSDGNLYFINFIDGIVYKYDLQSDLVSNLYTVSVSGTSYLPTTTIGNKIYSIPALTGEEILELEITPADQIASSPGAYVLVYIENLDLSIASEVKKYVFKEACEPDIHIHWENKFGAQDSYTFKGRIVRGFNHKSENYLKPNGNNIASTTRGVATLSNTVEHTFEVYSKSIKRSEVNWIQEMFYNKRAWTEEDGHLLPIIIENGRVVEYDSENGIYQVSFDFYYANLTNGSRG